MNLIKTRKKVNSLLSDLKVAKRACREERRKLAEAKEHLTFVEEAQQAVQLVAKEIQQHVHKQIANVVKECLDLIFVNEGYGFKIRFDKKRNRTEAVLILTKNEHEIIDPLNADSGGVCEISALPLRVACLIMSKPKLRRLLVLDEPFKSLSAEYWERTRMLINKLSEDFGIQIIMVTHNPYLQTGKVIKL